MSVQTIGLCQQKISTTNIRLKGCVCAEMTFIHNSAKGGEEAQVGKWEANQSLPWKITQWSQKAHLGAE